MRTRLCDLAWRHDSVDCGLQSLCAVCAIYTHQGGSGKNYRLSTRRHRLPDAITGTRRGRITIYGHRGRACPPRDRQADVPKSYRARREEALRDDTS